MNEYKKHLLKFDNKIGKISNVLNFIGTFITIIALGISISLLNDAKRIYGMDINGYKFDLNLRAAYSTTLSKYI